MSTQSNSISQKSIRKNYIYNTAYQILMLITPLVTSPYVARVLQPDGVGTVSYVESIVSYFSLFAVMGISTYGQREISYCQDDFEKRSEVFWNTKILGFFTSGITLVVYIIFALFQRTNSAIYLIFSLNLAANFVDITWFFQGMEDFAKTVMRNVIVKILHIAYIFLFVRAKNDLIIYVFGIGAFSLLGNLSLWAYLPKYIKRVPISRLHPFRNIKTVLSLFVPTVAIQIYTVLDKTMIGIITGSPFENGYYEQALKVSQTLLAVVTSLGTVMVPRIGHYFANENHGEICRLMYRGYRFVWFLGIPLCLGLIMASDKFVPWFFGSGYEKVIPLLRITAFLILAIGINNVTGVQYLIPTQRQNLFTLTVLIGAGTNFCLNLVLIHYFQSIGAAIASVMAETVIAVIQLIIVRRELSSWQILKDGLHYYIAGGVMVVILWVFTHTLSPSLPHTLWIVILGAVTYFGVLLLLRDEFFLSNVKKITDKLKR